MRGSSHSSILGHELFNTELMSRSKSVTIIDLSNMACKLAKAECNKAGLPFTTDVQIGLASGLDVVLSLLEESSGLFKGLSNQSAERVTTYFRAEAERSKYLDRHIAIWYDCWAKALAGC